MSERSPRIYLAPASAWHLVSSDALPPPNEQPRHSDTCPVCSSGPWMFGAADAATVPCPHAHLISPIDEDLRGKTILLVQPYCIRRRRLLYNLKSFGVRILGYQSQPTPGMKAFIADEDWLIGPPDDFDQALAAVNEWTNGGKEGEQRSIDAIWSYDEYGIVLAAQLAEAFSLSPSQRTPPETVMSAKSKQFFRESCKKHHVPHPAFVSIASEPASIEELDAILKANNVTLPCVSKPSCAGGSFQVLRADDLTQLFDAIHLFWQALPSFLAAAGLKDDSSVAQGGMMIESLITGQEVDVDCVVHKGQLLFACISDNRESKALGGYQSFVEEGGTCPSALPSKGQEKLLHLTAQVVAMFGEEVNGCLHFEAKYDVDKDLALPIELNARIGGAECFTDVLSAWGLNLAHCHMRIACGLKPQLPPNLHALARSIQDPGIYPCDPVTYVASINFVPEWSGFGIIDALEIQADAMTHANFVDCDFYYRVEDKVALPPAGFSALGWMVCKSPEGPSEAVDMLEELLKRVVMELREPLNTRLSVRLPSGKITDVQLLGPDDESHAIARVKRSPSMLIRGTTISPQPASPLANSPWHSGSKRFSFMRASSTAIPSPLSFGHLSSIPRLDSGAFVAFGSVVPQED